MRRSLPLVEAAPLQHREPLSLQPEHGEPQTLDDVAESGEKVCVGPCLKLTIVENRKNSVLLWTF